MIILTFIEDNINARENRYVACNYKSDRLHVHTDITWIPKKQKWCIYKYHFYFTPSEKHFSGSFVTFKEYNPIQFETTEFNKEFDSIEAAKAWVQLDVNKYWNIFIEECSKI